MDGINDWADVDISISQKHSDLVGLMYWNNIVVVNAT